MIVHRVYNIIVGKGFSNEENFGQFPLQVNGFRDVHESLEAATALGAIETVSNDTTQKSGQEVCHNMIPLQVSFKNRQASFNFYNCKLSQNNFSRNDIAEKVRGV